MPLTPIDIQQKTFGPELRGYNMDEVDDFLDEVVATLKDYDQRVRDAQDRIRALEAEIATRGEDETAISRALVAAQKQADALLAEARDDADRIRSDAHDESDRLRSERDSERMALTQEIARMRATVADLKRRMLELAASVGEDLDSMDTAAATASAEIVGSPEAEPAGGDEPAGPTDWEGDEETGPTEWGGDDGGPGERDEDGGSGHEPEHHEVAHEEISLVEAEAHDVDDETWAEVEESYESAPEREEEPERPAAEGDLGDLADELANEASTRAGQHLSPDEAGGRSGRRPWERGSV